MARARRKSTKTKTPLHWSFWLGVSFFVLVIIGVLFASYSITEKMVEEESMPVSIVKVSGEMPYTIKADIDGAIAQVNLGNFFQVDVDEIQRQVMNLPWVYSVSVRKQWPNQVNIYVVDQTPVARWNGDFFLMQKVMCSKQVQIESHTSCPHFTGQREVN